MNRKLFVLIVLTLLLLTLGGQYGETLAQAGQRLAAINSVDTAFTYQGTLNDNGAPANDTYDFRFSLYDDLTVGTKIGGNVLQTLGVNGGVFITSLDFGGDAFDGDARYLEIAVRLNGVGASYTTLTPRQPITAVPYAAYANKTEPVGNVIVVAKSGGDFTTLTDALASITTASASNRYLIKVGPGIYQEKVDVKDYVDIEGSGEGITILRGLGGSTLPTSAGNSATLRATGVVNAEVRWLTVESDGTGNTISIAIWTSGTTEAFRIHHITAIGSGGTNENYGIVLTDSSVSTIDSVTAIASGGAQSFGIRNSASSPTLNNVTAMASDASFNNFGIDSAHSAPTMNNITAMATDGTNSAGIHNTVSSPMLNNVTATAADATSSYGILNFSFSSPKMDNVRATASDGINANYGVYNSTSAAPTMSNVIATASGGADSYGVFNWLSSAPTLDNVIADASGGTNSNSGVYNDDSLVVMKRVRATASGGTTNYGVYNTSASPTMENVTASASGGSRSYGVYNDASSPRMHNVSATATGGTVTNRAVYNDGSSPTMKNVTALGADGSSTGVYNDNASSPTILDSTLTGSSSSIFNSLTSSAQVANSMLDGSLFGVVPGTFTCFNNYDASLAAVACP
ncbi:MAG: pectinesterase family protein [Chloroflexota bacterium]